MKLNSPGFLLVCFLIASCTNNKKNNIENSVSQIEESKKAAPINCFRYATISDTIILKLIYVGESITGTLVYTLLEKDKNMGTIQGSMRGDILVADYTFMSEGVVSTRQVAFKKEKDFFVEGYGDINENNGRVFFKNLDSLQFNQAIILTKIDCRE